MKTSRYTYRVRKTPDIITALQDFEAWAESHQETILAAITPPAFLLVIIAAAAYLAA